jgi:hypothetical protein
MARYAYFAQMDIPPEHEAEFNRIYDVEHVPEILKVKGVNACTRFILENATRDGVATKTIPLYAALYDIDSPDVIKQPAWREAADRGNWKPRIRPHTFNRIHCVFRKIG